MIRTCFLFVFFLGLIDIEVLAQQEQDLNLLFPISDITNRNVFFNRKDINPSQINDTVRFDAYWLSHKELAGYSNSPRDNLFSVSGNVFNTRSLYGIEFELYKNDGFRKQTLKFTYGYKFRLNEKSNIKAGTSFGFSKFSILTNSWYMSDPTIETTNWSKNPNVNVGITYNWLYHNIGLSYLDIIKSYSEFENNEYNVSTTIITANYFATFKLPRNFNISPELILADYLGKINIILKGTVTYHEKFTLGFIAGQYDVNFGIMSKCLLFNKVELGYLFEKINDSNVNAGSYAHNFKLGFILK
ncbi:MAG TPA: hypothetical protein DIW31_06855 [Bacteroidales bacterium]|nr:hypothetical protein [Bacteroidales bacterium]